MAVQSRGSKGEPQFDANAADDQAADLTLLGSEMYDRGTRLVRDAAGMAQLVWDGIAYEGLLVHNTTDGGEYLRTGGSWVRQNLMLRGKVARRSVSAGGVSTETINFPAGSFSSPPVVVAGVDSNARDTSVTVDSVTNTSAVLRLGVNGGEARNVGATWIALPG